VPGAVRRAAGEARRSESPFEQAVREAIAREGFRADGQVQVGGFTIDIVVTDGLHQVAIECDGDRLHPLDKIPDDMARQAILERVGWRFIRVRATRFFQDPDGTIAWIVKELRRLGVDRRDPTALAAGDPTGENLRNKVIKRAWQLMRDEQWVNESRGVVAPPPPEENTTTGKFFSDTTATGKYAPASDDPVEWPAEEGAPVAEIVVEDTTEPHFVIVEGDGSEVS
jgi:very-short-patch-repair endonuclease